MNGYHTTSINDSIEPTKDDLLAVAVKAGFNKKRLKRYIAISNRELGSLVNDNLL